MKSVKLVLVLFIAALFSSCSTLRLTPVDFSWPLESVVQINQNGVAQDVRHSLAINTKPLYFAETGDSTKYSDQAIRIIRDAKGFYYITAENFTSVYVFKDDESSMIIENKIVVNIKGLKKPAFNLRAPYVELIDGTNKLLLDATGVKGDK